MSESNVLQTETLEAITVANVMGKLRKAVNQDEINIDFSRKVQRSRLSRGSSTRTWGWYGESVDRNGRSALTVNYRVLTPAECVLIKLEYRHFIIGEAEKIMSVLTNLGYRVSLNGDTIFVKKVTA
jgi:hypothetical protein